MRGRKPKPAAVRALHNSRKRPHHHEEPVIPTPAELVAPPPGDDPAFQRVEFAPPRGLIQAERRYWAYFMPLLAGAKVLTAADVETLADYCRACVAVDQRGRRLRLEFRKKEMDTALVRMLDAQVRGWVEKKTKLAGELGLTAISRTRVAWSGHEQVLNAEKKPLSKLAQLQAQASSLRRPVGMP